MDGEYEYSTAKIFFNNLIKEIIESKNLYGMRDSRTLAKYYYDFVKYRENYNYYKHYYAAKLMHLLKYINPNVSILDAGCGTGSEAILCGILGASVTGIDASEKKLRVASKRVNYYSKLLGKEILVNFHCQNIFNHNSIYDIIWVNEAISHISPPEKFIDLCYNNLEKGGKLIVSDSNKLNPLMYLNAKKAQKRWGGVLTTREDLIKGEKIPYAVEKYFPITHIKTLLSSRFKIVKLIPIGYFPFFIFNKFEQICIKLEEFISCLLPILNKISANYIIVCTKIK